MKKLLIIFVLFVVGFSACVKKESVKRPKIVVGLVIDQMRWDYLYRYSSKFGNDGFKRLMRDGFNCQNTMLNYIPEFTGPGHTCIYTGSVPSIHGIAGNDWLDNRHGFPYYCVTDSASKLVTYNPEKKTIDTTQPSYSPKNLLTTTITDELRLATNFRSRTFGVAIKDRGAILPAGHAANCAYWYNDKSGDFVTSTYYDAKYQNPEWLKQFNAEKNAGKLASKGWYLSNPLSEYTQSTADSTGYEDAFKGESALNGDPNPIFPHKFSHYSDSLSRLKVAPAGNTLTLEMARACIKGEKLGMGDETDFLAVSLSSPDYTGHQFGVNAVEMEDMYIKLDQEIADFLNYLDQTYGMGNYLFFMTADHAGAHNQGFLQAHKIHAGATANMTSVLNRSLKDELQKELQIADTVKLIDGIMNYQVFLNERFFRDEPNGMAKRDRVKAYVQNWLLHVMPERYGIPTLYVVDMENMEKTPVPEPVRTMMVNGYHRNRSGVMQIILNPGYYEYESLTGTTHGTWNPYDSHIPLLFYGWSVPRGETHDVVNMTDISPTLAAMLHIQMPNGCIGKPITSIIK